MLIDHTPQIDHVAGSMETIREDEKGLYFRALAGSAAMESQ
jgi:phage head maturation protease